MSSIPFRRTRVALVIASLYTIGCASDAMDDDEEELTGESAAAFTKLSGDCSPRLSFGKLKGSARLSGSSVLVTFKSSWGGYFDDVKVTRRFPDGHSDTIRSPDFHEPEVIDFDVALVKPDALAKYRLPKKSGMKYDIEFAFDGPGPDRHCTVHLER
jgi:hypothetical protein